MAKGLSTRAGAPPDPNALRRENDRGEWVTLPIEGRDGPLPEWPLDGMTDRERIFWEREWRRPQAVMWEQNNQIEEVAMMVRALAEAEKLDATVASRTLVRQLFESLGVSIPGLQRNKWKIGDGQIQVSQRRLTSDKSRKRFKVMAGGKE